MTDRKVFNLFYGAREAKPEMYKGAVASGADINFAYEGRKAMRGGAGRWYYGDLMWYTPDGVDGEKGDTLLHIAVKIGNTELLSWLLSLDEIDVTRKNSNGLTALDVAKVRERADILELFGGDVAEVEPEISASESGSGAASLGDNAAAEEMGRLKNANRALKSKNDDLETEVSQMKQEIEKYKEMIREKDAVIGELQNDVLERDTHVNKMMHHVEILKEELAYYTDVRQADAETYEEWGQSGFHGEAVYKKEMGLEPESEKAG